MTAEPSEERIAQARRAFEGFCEALEADEYHFCCEIGPSPANTRTLLTALGAATARAERAEAELANMRKLANREGPLSTVDILPAPAQPRRDPFMQQPAAAEPAGEGGGQ